MSFGVNLKKLHLKEKKRKVTALSTHLTNASPPRLALCAFARSATGAIHAKAGHAGTLLRYWFKRSEAGARGGAPLPAG